MIKRIVLSLMVAALALFTTLLVPSTARAADEAAARELARANNCFKCHAVDKKKDGPGFNETAAKYKGKADAQAKLVKHLTSGAKVKFEDGHEEEHKVIKAKDEAQVKNLVDWILSVK